MLLARRAAGGKHKGGAVQLVLDAAGHDAHHAFVKVGVEHADGGRGLLALVKQALGHQHGLLAHAALDLAAFAVDAVQRGGQLGSAACVVCQQAFDAQRHVGQAACGVDARAQGKAKVERGGGRRLAACRVEQGGHASRHLACADAPQALGHQAAVVGVELDHIGHGAQGDQGEQRVKLRLGGGIKNAACTQLGPQCQQHVEHHAHPGHGLALERAAGLVGVDDGVGRRQGGAGQVVVGDEHLQAQGLGLGHAFHAGNAVVHGDEHIGPAFLHAAGDGWGEAVAVGHAVGHQVVHVFCAQQAQAAHAHGAGGGAVAVVVGHDDEAQVLRHGVGQQAGSGVNAFHAFFTAGGQQAGQAVVQLVFALHAARGVQAGQQRVHACLLQRPGGAGGNVSCYYFHSCSRTSIKRWGLKRR